MIDGDQDHSPHGDIVRVLRVSLLEASGVFLGVGFLRRIARHGENASHGAGSEGGLWAKRRPPMLYTDREQKLGTVDGRAHGNLFDNTDT